MKSCLVWLCTVSKFSYFHFHFCHFIKSVITWNDFICISFEAGKCKVKDTCFEFCSTSLTFVTNTLLDYDKLAVYYVFPAT